MVNLRTELTVDIAPCFVAQDGFDDIHVTADGVVWQPALCDVIDCHLQAGLAAMKCAGQYSTVMTGCAIMTLGKHNSPHTLQQAGRVQQCNSQTSCVGSLQTNLPDAGQLRVPEA